MCRLLVFVSTAAVALRDTQELNKELDRKANILRAAGLLENGSGEEIATIFEEQITTKYVDLATGKYVGAIEGYDQRAAMTDPEQSVAIPPGQDDAGIQRREKISAVYLVEKSDGTTETLILPVYTKGLWSTMYGFLALDGDLRTVKGLGFYEHGETPGLGGEVDNPKWKAQWSGKLVFDDAGNVALHVIKGSVNPNSPDAEYEVDGLSGATITSRGVSNLLEYWMGPHGFGPYLKHLKSAGGDDG